MDEFVDILDSGGVMTGTRAEKARVHREGQWHRCAHVWIVTADGRVLLQLRAAAKENFPGRWDVSAAGHLAAGENAVDAAIRETREELGIQLESSELRRIGEVRVGYLLNGGAYRDNEFHEIFLVERDVDPSALRLDPAEVAGAALVALAELRSRIVARDPSLVPHGEEYSLLLDAIDAKGADGT